MLVGTNVGHVGGRHVNKVSANPNVVVSISCPYVSVNRRAVLANDLPQDGRQSMTFCSNTINERHSPTGFSAKTIT